MFAIAHAREHGDRRGDLRNMLLSNVERWPIDSEVLAGTLQWDEWFDIYQAVRAIE
jgi:hypothetical protein